MSLPDLFILLYWAGIYPFLFYFFLFYIRSKTKRPDILQTDRTGGPLYEIFFRQLTRRWSHQSHQLRREEFFQNGLIISPWTDAWFLSVSFSVLFFLFSPAFLSLRSLCFCAKVVDEDDCCRSHRNEP